jgi:histidine ammonia-lyase
MPLLVSPPVDAPVEVGAGRITIGDVVRVARDGQPVARLALEAEARVQATASWVAETVEQIGHNPKAYYGINTGFGALAGRSALDSEYLTRVLGRNLIASHSVGVGPYFDEAVVRAAMFIRAQSLAQGYSGVRPLIIETLIRMLNSRVYPAVPEQGSLGASGDLAPLAHLLLVMCRAPEHLDDTDGEAFVPCLSGDVGPYHLTHDHASAEQTLWRRVSGTEAMEAAGGKVELHAKEALALTNGSTFSAALAALALADAQNILDHAELAVAMTLEGIRGFRDPFYPQVHRARGHQNAEHVGARILSYLEGSELLDPGDLRTDPKRVPPQDPYSVRCAPQVLGTIADTLEMSRRWVDMEINAVTDNPLIFLDLPRDYKTISGGNFHGAPIGMAMDFLGIALTDLGSMSDRRMFMLTDFHPNDPEQGIPGFLVDEPRHTEGLNSGLMMLQATAAALVSDCKVLAHPDSVDSIPSSANQEEHVSMSMNAARHARDIAGNVEHIVALEVLCATQAIGLQLAKPGNGSRRIGQGTRAAYDAMRTAGIKFLSQDRVLAPDITKAIGLVRCGALLRAAREAIAG